MNDNPEIEDTKPRPAYRPADPNVPPAQPPEQPASPVPAAGQPGLRAKASPYPRLSPAPAGPPRWLLWGVIGLFVLGMLGIGGAIAATNDALKDAPETVNSDAFGAGWLLKVFPYNAADLDKLMDAATYKSKIESGEIH